MTENADGSEAIEVDWSEADDMAVEPANTFILQAGPDSNVLNLGYVTPPVGQKAPPTRVRVHVVGRVLLTPETTEALMKGLANSLRDHQEYRAQRAQEPGDES